MRSDLLDGRPLRPLKISNEPAESLLLRDCASKLIESKKAEWSNAKHAQQWINTLETYVFPKLGNKRPDEIDVMSVVDTLSPIWATKTETASRVRQRLEAILDWAIVHGLRGADNPARWKNNLERVLPSPAKISPVEHFSALPHQDLPQVFQKLRETDTLSAQLLVFVILTVSRSGEARGARWGEMSIDRKTWRIPAERKKERRELSVPLADEAIELLNVRSKFREGEFVFGTKPLSDVAVSKQFKRVAGPYTVHGLRSTFRQWAAESGRYPEHVLEKVLGHASKNQLVSVYQRSDLFDQRMLVMDDWAAYCLRG
jgi:integrase